MIIYSAAHAHKFEGLASPSKEMAAAASKYRIKVRWRTLRCCLSRKSDVPTGFRLEMVCVSDMVVCVCVLVCRVRCRVFWGVVFAGSWSASA